MPYKLVIAENIMKKAFAAALVLSGLYAAPAAATLIPAIDAPNLVTEADLIVVGRATVAGDPTNKGAGLLNYVILVDRVLKGTDAPSQVSLQLDVSELDHDPIAPQQYGMFMLRSLNAQGSYVPVDPFHPALPASPFTAAVGDGHTTAVMGELVGVLCSPAADLIEVGGELPPGWPASTNQHAQWVYQYAAGALASFGRDTAGSLLGTVAASSDVVAQLWGAYGLFLLNGAKLQDLVSLQSILLDPPAELTFAVDNLAFLMQGRVTSPAAAPLMNAFLTSRAASVRQAAVAVLGRIQSP
jgi:hypothetical protein